MGAAASAVAEFSPVWIVRKVAGKFADKPPAPPAPPSLPSPPSPPSAAEAQAKAEEAAKRKKASLTQTLYTNPLGLNQEKEANIARKTLLGQ